MPLAESLVSTVVMGVLLVGAAAAVARMRRREQYTPRLRAAGQGVAALTGETADSRGVDLDTVALVTAVLVAVLAVAAIALDAGTMVLTAVAPALIAVYFAWGVYSLGRSRGLPRAHSVGLSLWVFGVVLVGVIAAKLLFG
ncbi:MAG: hypothetical protein ABEH83_01985 [Halobacterium sp.]